jgi:hypothetical protein
VEDVPATGRVHLKRDFQKLVDRGGAAAVLGRQLQALNAFGCPSAAGCRLVERMLSVVQTRRRHGRSVLGDLDDALVAQRRGSPAPSRLSAE